MTKSSDIHRAAIEALIELLRHTGCHFRTQRTPSLRYLLGLQHRVNSGQLKIKPSLCQSQFQANVLTDCLKELLRIAVITGNCANKSKATLSELLDALGECVDLITSVAKKAKPNEAALLAARYLAKEQQLQVMQKALF